MREGKNYDEMNTILYLIRQQNGIRIILWFVFLSYPCHIAVGFMLKMTKSCEANSN